MAPTAQMALLHRYRPDPKDQMDHLGQSHLSLPGLQAH